ncbi:MAG: hypothetical protein HQL31_14095, partial [Planctomycetes bacterium]|nr:hypothetical protein [Planctomycetota bacterium]
YDLANDPWEMRNLYFDPAYHTKVEEIKGDLLDWLVTTTRPASVLVVNSCGGRRPAPKDVQIRERYNVWTHRDGKIGREEILPFAGGNYL